METVSATSKVWTRDSASAEKRNVWTALKRGLHLDVPIGTHFMRGDEYTPPLIRHFIKPGN